MNHRPARRTALAVAAAVLLPALAACSTGSTKEGKDTPDAKSSVDANAFPVTIEHAYGETEIDEEPKRVVTIGWAEHDFVLSLGVVPVGASKIDWGGGENGSTGWFDEEVDELGVEPPQRIDDADGIDINAIAELEPDLVLATGWDMSEAEYKKLSRVADVVPYKTAPYTATWQESLEITGLALGRTELADQVAEETEAALTEFGAEHPDIQGTTFVFGGISISDPSRIDYLTGHDPRSAVLVSVGMEMAPSVVELAGDSQAFYESISAERGDELESDIAVLIPYEDTAEADFARLLEEDPLLSRVPAIARGDWVTEVDPKAMLALSAPTPLSIPWAADGVLVKIAEVAEK